MLILSDYGAVILSDPLDDLMVPDSIKKGWSEPCGRVEGRQHDKMWSIVQSGVFRKGCGRVREFKNDAIQYKAGLGVRRNSMY